MWLPLFGVVPSSQAEWLRSAIQRAQEVSGVKLEVLACLMDRTATQLCRQVQGKEHLSWQSFLKLAETDDGRAFGAALLLETAALFNLTNFDEAIAELQIAILRVQRKRMAKASLQTARKREVA